MRYFLTGSPCPSLRLRVGFPFRRDFASAGRHSSRFRKRAPSLRMRAGVPVSTGLCKRRAKPESGPRETGRRSSSEGNNGREANSSASQSRRTHSNEGNSSCPIRPASNQLPRASCAQQVPMCAGGPCRDCWSSFSLHPAQHRNYHPSGGSCT